MCVKQRRTSPLESWPHSSDEPCDPCWDIGQLVCRKVPFPMGQGGLPATQWIGREDERETSEGTIPSQGAEMSGLSCDQVAQGARAPQRFFIHEPTGSK
jgi:hypothetical protein